jgi:hypothetical protein
MIYEYSITDMDKVDLQPVYKWIVSLAAILYTYISKIGC